MRFLHPFIYIFLIWGTGCSPVAHSLHNDKISGFEVRDSSNILGQGYYRVFYAGDMVMYEKRYYFDSSASALDTDTISKINMNRPPGNQSYYFVYHRDSAFGIRYDDDKSPELDDIRIPVDSTMEWVRGSGNFGKLLARTPDSTSWSAGQSVFREFYTIPQQGDTPTIRVKMYYSPALKNIPESIDPVADSMKNMKLFKFEIQIDPIFDARVNAMSPEQYFMGELRQMEVFNEEKVMSYIQRYKARENSEVRNP